MKNMLLLAAAGGAVKIHPVLLPASVEFAPAYQVAPPVAIELLTDMKSTPTTPLVLDRVKVPLAPVRDKVRRFPEVPDAVKFATVVVTFGKMIVQAVGFVLLISANVFVPVIESDPAPPWLSSGYDNPPPANVFALPEVMLIVPVPELMVKLVEVAAFHAVPAPTKVNVPEPNVIWRTFEFDELKRPTLKV